MGLPLSPLGVRPDCGVRTTCPRNGDHSDQAEGVYRQYRKQFQAELAERAGLKSTGARMQARVVKLVEARLVEDRPE
jgi:hypothetical protein